MWKPDGTLRCDTCHLHNSDYPVWAQVPEKVSHQATVNYARAHGWHILDVEEGPHLCKRCVRSGRPELPPAPPVLADDQTLF